MPLSGTQSALQSAVAAQFNGPGSSVINSDNPPDVGTPPDKSDPRWRKLSEVTGMISEWGVYWGRIDQNTVARVFRIVDQWHLVKGSSATVYATIKPPFKIFIEHWGTPVIPPSPYSAYDYEPGEEITVPAGTITQHDGPFSGEWSTTNMPTQAPAPPDYEGMPADDRTAMDQILDEVPPFDVQANVDP